MTIIIQLINLVLMLILIVNTLMLHKEMEGKTSLDEAEMLVNGKYTDLAEKLTKLEKEIENWKGD